MEQTDSPTETSGKPWWSGRERDDGSVTSSADGPPGTPARGLILPTRLGGRYDVESELGRGGMGVVYRAFDRHLERPVALKVLRRSDPQALVRFESEARITARLQHPSIVPVFDLVSDDGVTFYTMRLVEGRTLARLAQAPEGASPRLLRAYVQACRALAFAHGQAVVHRDVKPQNVMVGTFGDVHVLDWGLARDLARPDPQAPATAGRIVGTPAYMAPEQLAGGAIGPEADVYGLGGTLFTALTGRPPHRTLARPETPPDPRELRPDAPAPLAALCAQAMTARPEARPGAGRLADAVEAWLDGLHPEGSRPIAPHQGA